MDAMDEFPNFDFSKLSTEQMDALLNYDPFPFSEQATSLDANFAPNASDPLPEPADFTNELFDFGTTESHPMHATFDDHRYADSTFGQLQGPPLLGAEIPSNHLDGPNLLDNFSPHNARSSQRVDDTGINSLNELDIFTSPGSSSEKPSSTGVWQGSLEHGSRAGTMVSIMLLAVIWKASL